MITRRAVVEWLSREQGGRNHPPSGDGPTPYVTVVRFVDPEEPWPGEEAWSLVVEKDSANSTSHHWNANVGFLVPEAPHEALEQLRLCELYEGRKCVARGRIVGDRDMIAAGNDAIATTNSL